jgi:hypothetical protein
MYESEKCHCQLLVAGTFDNPSDSQAESSLDAWFTSGRYFEPSKKQSDMLVPLTLASYLPPPELTI